MRRTTPAAIALGVIVSALGGGTGWIGPAPGHATADDAVRTYYAPRPTALADARRRIAEGDPTLRDVLAQLVESAADLLTEPPPSVTHKRTPAPSGDPHDYASLAPYYWPDPTTADGLPYVRRDGRRNPDSEDSRCSDRARSGLLGDGVETLALAWYFTRDVRYAERAAEYARVWFVAADTKMNPHLRYAQAIRGANTGRPAGIIEGRDLVQAIDALALVADAEVLAPAERTAVDTWANHYLDWLLESVPGRAEAAADNNHGTFYDEQVATLALVLGRRALAHDVLAAAGPRRIAVQIEPDGRQPHELARTRSLGYSIYNLRGLCQLAALGEHVGLDLWRFSTDDGRSIRAALVFLVPFLGPAAAPWPFEQMTPVSPQDSAAILWYAKTVYREPGLDARLDARSCEQDRFRLFFQDGAPGSGGPTTN